MKLISPKDCQTLAAACQGNINFDFPNRDLSHCVLLKKTGQCLGACLNCLPFQQDLELIKTCGYIVGDPHLDEGTGILTLSLTHGGRLDFYTSGDHLGDRQFYNSDHLPTT